MRRGEFMKRNAPSQKHVGFFWWGTLAVCLLVSLQSAWAGQARLDTAFPTVNGSVLAIAEQDGKVFIGGNFDQVQTFTGGFGPLSNTTAELSRATPYVEGQVYCVAVDPSGAVFIGGNFLIVGGLNRSYVARILPDGSVDTNWNPGANNVVYSMALSGTDLYIGGNFSTVQGAPRQKLAKIDAGTGVLSSWAPAVGGNAVKTLGISGTSVFVGGEFSSINSVNRNKLAEVDATTGTLSAWNPDANDDVYALAVSGGFVFVGGRFTFVGQASRARVAKLSASTGFAESWNPGVSGEANTVEALAVDGSSVYVGGNFAIVAGAPRTGIAEVDFVNGTASSWIGNTVLGADIYGIFVTSTTVAVAGEFTSLGGPAAESFALIDRTTGTTQAWNARPDGNQSRGRAIAVSGSEVFVAGESFTSVGPSTRNRIAQIDLATKRVTSWNANLVGSIVQSLVVDTGVVYVGGTFSSAGGQPRANLAQLDSMTAGAVNWQPNPNGPVGALAVGTGVIYAGGNFSTVSGMPRTNIAAIDAAGMATNWQPNANFYVHALAVAGGNVFVGGEFTTIGGASRPSFAEIDAVTGNATGFQPLANSVVQDIHISGGSVYVGGSFTSLLGQTRNRIAEIDLATHTLTSWNPNADSGVNSIASSGGVVYVAGGFLVLKDTIVRTRVAQIDSVTGFPTNWNPNSMSNGLAVVASASGVHFGRFHSGNSSIQRVYSFIGSNVPPVADLNGPDIGNSATSTFVEDFGPVLITDGVALTVTDTDDTNVTSATVTIDVRFDGSAETLTADTSGTSINVAFSLNTLTLTGGTKLQMQQVLRTIRYNNTSNSPNTTPRTILFNLNDGFDIGPSTVSTVNITPTNDKPTANPQSVSTRPTIAKAITLAGSDLENDALTFEIVTPPQHGTFSGTIPNLTFSPDLLPTPYAGTDSFTFRVHDGTEFSDPATVSIIIANDSPTANSQNITAHQTVAKAVTLTGGDINGDPVTFIVVSQPQFGLLTGTAPSLVYTATAYKGPDSFTFKLNDGVTDSNIATVSINVANAAPAAVAQNLGGAGAEINPGVPKAITLAASDADVSATLPNGDPLTYSYTQPTNGTVSGTPPNVIYTSASNFNGFDSFTFKANDGIDDSNVATISLTVTGLAPTIGGLVPDQCVAGNGGNALTLTVNGANYVAGSKVRWNGSDLATTVDSTTKLTAIVPNALISATATGRASVQVFSPAPGGGQSPVTFFFVYSGTATGQWIVSNTNDAGAGSLRFAMDNCRNGDTILFSQAVFDLSNADAATVINVIGAPLPSLDDGAVTIDCSNRRVTLNGSSAGSANGIDIMSNGNVLRGLSIVSFTQSGVRVRAGAKNNQIGGVRTTGGGPNGQGLRLSRCGAFGVEISGAGTDFNVVKGCWIGLDASGTVAESNLAGVLIQDGARTNQIGSTIAGEGNVISGNAFEGVTISGAGTDGNIVQGNTIGTAATAAVAARGAPGAGSRATFIRQAVANGSSAVFLSRGTQGSSVGADVNDAPDIVIEKANAIGFNGGAGIEVRALDSRANSARGNAISANLRGGISLFDGSNGGITKPKIKSIARLAIAARSVNSRASIREQVAIEGTSDRDGTIEIFNDTGDQGATFLARSRSTNGRFAIALEIAGDENVTATLTDDSGNTSPFELFAGPRVTSALSAIGTVGVPFTFQIAGTNSPNAFSSTALPDGLVLNSSSGLISGTPLVAGTFDLGITASNGAAGDPRSSSANLTIIIGATGSGPGGAPVITSLLTASASQGNAFTYTITAAGTAPIVFSAAGLPAGLTLTGNTISGTPTVSGVAAVTLTAVNGAGSDSKVLQLAISPPPGRVNLPPQIASTPSIQPFPARVGQLITFAAAATDPDGDLISYTWDFGDGTSASGQSVTHTYANAGTYLILLTLTDGIQPASIVLQLTIFTAAAVVPPGPVVAEEIDSDGDGVSDAMELLANTDPINPADAPPDGGTVTADKVSVALKFSGTGSDSIKATYRLPITETLTGAAISIRLGEVSGAFTALSDKGKSGTGNATLKYKQKTSTLQWMLKKQNLRAKLGANGLLDETTPKTGKSVSVPIGIVLFRADGTKLAMDGSVNLLYKAKAGKTGKAKQN